MLKILVSVITIILLSSCSMYGSCCKSKTCNAGTSSEQTCECKDCKDGSGCSCDKSQKTGEEQKSCH